MRPDPEKIRFWGARARAYDRICRRWDVFPRLSNRLVDLLPADLQGPVLDIGAGPGLTSETLLARQPRCQALLIEPSEEMLEVARGNLAGRPAQFFAMGLDGAAVRGLRAVAALASASMQFIDLEPAFGTLAHVVQPGGHVAFNLWWHHWEDTVGMKCMAGSDAFAQAVCRDAGLPLPPSPSVVPKVKTRTDLMNASSAHGFRFLFEQCDEYPTPFGYGVDYAAMDPDWPVKGLAPEVRQALLMKMHELAQGQFETLVSTRFLFQRAGDSDLAVQA
jgi:SAM-dependent methyltransferase